MKTIQEIMDASRPVADIINDLKVKTDTVPSWGRLEKEYDTEKHAIMLDPDFLPKNGTPMSRIALGWQKLAVKRMAELCFGIPVKRTYNAETEEQQKAVKVIEAIYKKNRMDAENINRARDLYASCEFATIWYTQEQETQYADEKSSVKLRCRSYSPKNGDCIYPLFDDYDDLIALSVEYSRTINNTTTTYFEVYTAEEHRRWFKSTGGWQEDMESEKMSIGKIAGVYGKRSEPIWEKETSNVSEAEYALSRNGNYIRKNSAPNWVVYADKEDLVKFGVSTKPENTIARNILHYPANAKAGFETWNQSVESLKFYTEQIRQNFFCQLQLPDMSFDSMKTTPMSGEARKMMFIDAQLKVLDEQGLWLEVFSREFNVIRAFAKLMFPSLASALDTLDVEFVITPYMIQDMAEKVNTYTTATAGKIMSQKTAIQLLGEVDDVNAEIKQIAEEEASIVEEPTY